VVVELVVVLPGEGFTVGQVGLETAAEGEGAQGQGRV